MKRSPIKRTAFLRKATKQQPGWAKAVKTVRERSQDRCEIKSEHCVGAGTETHHVLNRSQGGTANPQLLLRSCWSCHHYVTNNPAIAYERGWSIHEWDDMP